MRLYIAYEKDKTPNAGLGKRAKILDQGYSLHDIIARLKKNNIRAAIWSCEILSIDEDKDTTWITNERFERSL